MPAFSLPNSAPASFTVTAHQIGGAVAAYGAGLSRTILMAYTPALYAAGIACLFAAVIVFVIKKPVKVTT